MNTHSQRRFKDIAHQRLAALLLAASFVAIVTFDAAIADVPHILLHSLLDPGTNAQAGALQGYSVAVDGSIAVAGAPGRPVLDDRQAENSGVVKVYDATTGGVLHTLNNPSPAAYYSQSWVVGVDDYFGSSVAISGTRVVVGAPDEGAYVGGAYVYDLVSATPNVPIATLNNPNPDGSPGLGTSQSDHFGSSVAISGTRVVVGAPYNNAGTEGGIACVYELVSHTPTVPIAKLTNPSPEGYDRFGLSLAVDGTTIIVGDPFDNTTAPDRGAAYVFGPSLPSRFLRTGAQPSSRRVRHRPAL